MNNRIDAIYARQSVDKKDSISIESQIEFCKYELKGGSCREYTDKELLINNYLQNIPSCAILSSNISNCIGGKNGYTC